MKDYYVLEFLTILAILFAPLVALRVSVRLDEGKEIKKRKLDIFRTLMATRGAPLSPNHIDALNKILIDFYEDKEVVDSWKIYRDHLNYVDAGGQKPGDEKEWKVWSEKKYELLVDILDRMASALDYNISKLDIKKEQYQPQAYADIENELLVIRKGLVKIFEDKKAFPILAFVAPPPGTTGAQKLTNEIDSGKP